MFCTFAGANTLVPIPKDKASKAPIATPRFVEYNSAASISSLLR